MSSIFEEILRQRQRLLNEGRMPEKVVVGMNHQPEVYWMELSILGLSVEYTSVPGEWDLVRVIPKDCQGNG